MTDQEEDKKRHRKKCFSPCLVVLDLLDAKMVAGA
jgi:hypothetical protein